MFLVVQAANKKKVSKDDWERKLAAVELRKEDLNQLVMNFLVTEVRVAERPARLEGDTAHTPLSPWRVLRHAVMS